MNLPFSVDAFFEVFGHYNRELWPAVIVLWMAAAAGLVGVALGSPSRRADLAATGLLVLLWAWSGAVYHAAYFTAINPAAWLFAALFLVEAALLAWSGLRRQLSFGSSSTPTRAAGFGLAIYALAYPMLTSLGHPYPDAPTFGVPCPTAIFTVGLLLTCARLPVSVTLVPLAWSIVGGSASVVLGVTPDYALLLCGPLLAWKVMIRDDRTPVEWRTS